MLAAAVRLIDLGSFRPGGEEYLAENGSFGLATIRREQVTCGEDEIIFEYTGKGGTAVTLAPFQNDQGPLWRQVAACPGPASTST
jgi:DNA topoisomerase IB